MASEKEIRDRMKSINDTLKITNAMYLISSNKVRKARRMLAETEPFFLRVQDILDVIITHLPPGTSDSVLDLGQVPPMEERKRCYLVITDDKGLAGAYNHNVLKAAEAEIEKSRQDPRIYAVGEVGRSHFQKAGYELAGNFRYTVQSPNISRARDITAVLVDD
ncbi:MAG: F0F1 ATP synthase subunit gamma, partial [Lachnospiraceae bacterium]|nr:F0F1 ATP synthase subunit gamma [Lachnospiraceae bacterium]